MQKTNDILFSIIIPVYNTSKYIEKCLDSIIEAIDKDCEVIIINDGSTDNSDEVIKKYLKKIPKQIINNFTYLKKENKGLADTKNVGISLSHGKYISVVDSDDTIAENFYNDARKYVMQNYDVIIYDLYIKYEKRTEKQIDYIARAIREDSKGEFIDKIMNGAMQGSSCNKIIKKDLYKYEFPVDKEYEDVAVTPFILLDAKKIKYIPNPNYIYLQREKSIVASNTLDKAFYKICKNISDVLKEIDNIDKYTEVINVFFVDRTIDMLDLSLKTSKKMFCNKIEDFYEENKIIIKYIVEKDIINNKKAFLTERQYEILSKIYINLYNKNYKKVKQMLVLRRLVNWCRTILGSFKQFIKAIFGGIYG